ncbi:HD-GYP domain-containing protein [Bacillus pinisoli]|uniref:HD-GYP domain-containing protein n=1 Tax=Bacillus pinisoli TaxID=2901866 RepID=UPI001FF19B88|nr:HD domain-containing phosphohydrolase [Bacillus pinisoli]
MIDSLKLDKRVKNLLLILREKDLVTYRHSVRVANIVHFICVEWELPNVELITRSALLHDIGKLRIPTHILDKNAKLNEEEWTLMKNHASDSFDILHSLFSPDEIDFQMIRHHHENEDGTGYPVGLKSTNISYNTKLIRIIDSYEAMTGIRPYRKPLTKEDAIGELKRYSGIYYDRDMLERFHYTINKEVSAVAKSSYVVGSHIL